MADRLHVATHKGLFELARGHGIWEVANVQFLGDPVSAVLADVDGAVYAALDLGRVAHIKGTRFHPRDGGHRRPILRHLNARRPHASAGEFHCDE